MNDDYLMEAATAAQDNEAPVGQSAGEDGEAAVDDTQANMGQPGVGVDELAREREMHAATEARYKSLQGQYDSFQRKQVEFDKTREETAQLRESHSLMQAQLADMSVLVAGKQAPQVDEPLFDEALQGFLGDQSAGFTAALNRAAAKAAGAVKAEADQKIAALQAQLSEVQKKSQSVPFEVLRSSDSVYDEPGFAEFIAAEKDPIFGISIKEQMAQLHAQGKDVVPAIKRARDAYVAKRVAPAQAPEQVVNPRLSSAPSGAVRPSTAKVSIKSLQAEYEGYRQANLEKDRPRRMEIMRLLAQNGAI